MATTRAERAALVRLVPVLASFGTMRRGQGMTLRKRIGALERAHTIEPGDVALDLTKLSPGALQAMAEAYGESLDCIDNFWPALLARIGAAQDAGTYPQSLSDADLLALLHAFDAMEGEI